MALLSILTAIRANAITGEVETYHTYFESHMCLVPLSLRRCRRLPTHDLLAPPVFTVSGLRTASKCFNLISFLDKVLHY